MKSPSLAYLLETTFEGIVNGFAVAVACGEAGDIAGAKDQIRKTVAWVNDNLRDI